MKIDELHLYDYHLPLTHPISLATGRVDHREGFVLQLISESQLAGFGEIAPLPGFSRESRPEIMASLKRSLRQLQGDAIPDNLEELSGGFEQWLGSLDLPPSVRFGLESAVLGLLAAERRTDLSGLLIEAPRKHVTLNCMLPRAGQDELISTALERQSEGFRTFKIKVGGRDPALDVVLLAALREKLGDNTVIRLDANRQFTDDTIEGFVEAIGSVGIEYIEEPLSTLDDNLRLARSGRLPVALDESLQEIGPEQLADFPGVIAVVLKPTLLGLERTIQFARMAGSRSIMPVISSTLESSLGLSVLAQLSLVVTRHDIAMGIATAGIFAGDVLKTPLRPRGGAVARIEIPDPRETVQFDRLSEVEL